VESPEASDLRLVELHHQQFVDFPGPTHPARIRAFHLGERPWSCRAQNWGIWPDRGIPGLPFSELAAGLQIRETTIRSPGRHW